MELGDAVEFERDGRALESESAQDVGGQVAAVDRQARRAGQNRSLACSHCYKGIGFVLLHIHQWILGCFIFLLHFMRLGICVAGGTELAMYWVRATVFNRTFKF